VSLQTAGVSSKKPAATMTVALVSDISLVPTQSQVS
jgi:hypothetical protein